MITVQETFDPRAPLVPERVIYTRPRAEMDKVGLVHLSQLLHLAKPLEEYQAHRPWPGIRKRDQPVSRKYEVEVLLLCFGAELHLEMHCKDLECTMCYLEGGPSATVGFHLHLQGEDFQDYIR